MRRKYMSCLALLTVGVLGSDLFVNSASVAMLPRPDSTGAVSGKVFGADGRPIIDAEVLAQSRDYGNQALGRAWTNAQGEFLITDLAPGLYTIQTRKDDDGYPNSFFNLYDEGDPIETSVRVLPGSTSEGVVIYRTVKAAFLEGRVFDSLTHMPIKHAQVTVRRVDKSDRFLTSGLNGLVETAGAFKVLVPPLPVTLKVSSPGYVDWYYTESNQRRPGSLLLVSGTTRRIVVRLHPS
jgi:hypothetical protein